MASDSSTEGEQQPIHHKAQTQSQIPYGNNNKSLVIQSDQKTIVSDVLINQSSVVLHASILGKTFSQSEQISNNSPRTARVQNQSPEIYNE